MNLSNRIDKLESHNSKGHDQRRLFADRIQGQYFYTDSHGRRSEITEAEAAELIPELSGMSGGITVIEIIEMTGDLYEY